MTYSPPFVLNPIQKTTKPFVEQDVNLVVSCATGSGKTAIAEFCFSYHLERGGRVAYVAPYRSLVSEKFESWEKMGCFSKHGLVLHTGENAPSRDDYEGGQFLVTTIESFDSRVRSRFEWIRDIKCLVVDEAHLIGDASRGGALESALMGFTAMSPSSRLILLSGTLGNVNDIGRWIKRLNGKVTKCIRSSWRPVEIDLRHHVVDDGWEGKMAKTLELLEKKLGKTIVFVHSKKVGREITELLRSRGTKVAFHNASETKIARRKIEQAFDDQWSGLDILVSTSTLGSGINLGG